MTKDYELHTLPNGIRIVHRQVPYTQIAHCGIMLDIGSRDEAPHQQGLAHFWEHMAFKGTKKRKSYHILNRLEVVGGELNAYTTKEKVCFHASLLDRHFEKAVELIADITFHSTFPEKQLEKERGVILEEMAMYEDTPEDAIQDDFDEIIFPEHQMGANILGTEESLEAFRQQHLHDFISENLNTEQVVFASVSKLPFKQVLKVAKKYLSDIPHQSPKRQRTAPSVYRSQHVEVHKNISQAHCAIGRQAFSLKDERRLPFFMLVNLLGGQGMNSRFNLSLREKHGLVYSVDANYSPYIDTGILGIYFATDKANLAKAKNLIQKELNILREKPLGRLQLHTLKEQLMGQLAMSEESNLSFMLMMAKSILDLNRVETLPSIFADIQRVEAPMLQSLAQEMFDDTQLSSLTFLPE